MSRFTDIRAGGWVSRLPPALIPYALLARLDRPIGAWLLFFPGLWGILLARQPLARSLWLIALFAAGSVIMRGAGCVVNDLWDRKMDRLVARTAGRPLASGALKPIHALIFLAALLAIGLGILLLLDRAAQILGVISLVLVGLYPLAKRVTWWPQIVLGATFGWGAPMGYAAATGHLGWPVLPLYAASIAWILGYDTIYAHQDREDDALIGVKSTARLFAASSRLFLIYCYGAMILLLIVSFIAIGADSTGYIALILPILVLGWQIIRLNIDNPARCLTLFKLNREVGLLVAVAILLALL
ncbi:MAG: 4-hydroxybenzoate polyprenyltransferase [Rhodospirillales bacterium 20-60-12]|nr:MAG: 4-hydroxybenzoate polyprenyltransferase [Rhodospirillales bacterium 20-60-12]HQT67517.1 4-hydroxybenzoate octaprenyltransferase [Acetobacteraceae bacterium]HQU02837.1 4-hydroxybenzoate octaprenyltransferase [Acetobacteraceae bacterium]